MRIITKKRLYNKALAYLSRYESTTANLNAVLYRSVKRAVNEGQEISNDVSVWIAEIVKEMEKLGYVNDKRYGENLQRRLLSGGKSVRLISGKLKMAGLTDDLIDEIQEETNKTADELDLESATALVRKKKIGFLRPEELRKDFYKKDLAVLGRAGFSFEIAKKALSGEED
ncbi:MAG: RecX family transcriptional regulator [Alphaproteobacteria bacterium]|nr:RecX family transcriptional regulator [Alphaproteobacteria bacterium]